MLKQQTERFVTVLVVALKWLLIIWIAWLFSKFFWWLLTPEEVPLPIVSMLATPVKSGEQIKRLHVFGKKKTVSVAPIKRDSRIQPPRSTNVNTSGLSLIGVISGQPGVAILDDQARGQISILSGQEIRPGLTLTTVTRNRIEVRDENGVMAEITLNEPDQSQEPLFLMGDQTEATRKIMNDISIIGDKKTARPTLRSRKKGRSARSRRSKARSKSRPKRRVRSRPKSRPKPPGTLKKQNKKDELSSFDDNAQLLQALPKEIQQRIREQQQALPPIKYAEKK